MAIWLYSRINLILGIIQQNTLIDQIREVGVITFRHNKVAANINVDKYFRRYTRGNQDGIRKILLCIEVMLTETT